MDTRLSEERHEQTVYMGGEMGFCLRGRPYSALVSLTLNDGCGEACPWAEIK